MEKTHFSDLLRRVKRGFFFSVLPKYQQQVHPIQKPASLL